MASNAKLVMRLSQVQLTEATDLLKQGRLRLDSNTLKRILKATNMSQDLYKYHQKQGTKWKEFCRDKKGLLCFIGHQYGGNTHGFKVDDYLKLEAGGLDAFHSHLQTPLAQSLYNSASLLLEALDSQKMDPEFLWEGVVKFDVDKVSGKDLSEYLEPFPTITENYYDPSGYPDWRKPIGWRWEWPVDPTSLLDLDDRSCEICQLPECTCSSPSPGQIMPRIKYYGAKGRGLQAVSRKPGELAYLKGAFIGELTGQIAPPGRHDDGWAVEVKRGDFGSTSATPVCQIYCARMGNCFRLINHACKNYANAEFRVVVTSGRYKMLIYAKVNIQHGEELTVDYGKQYLRDQPCLCAAPDGQHHRQ